MYILLQVLPLPNGFAQSSQKTYGRDRYKTGADSNSYQKGGFQKWTIRVEKEENPQYIADPRCVRQKKADDGGRYCIV